MTPDGWERVPLQALLVDETPGFWGDAPTGENEISVVRSTNLRVGGRLDVTDVVRRSFPTKKLEQKALRPGDLLLERSGGAPKQPVGRVALFDLRGRWSFSNFMQRLRPNPSACEPKFLVYELDRFHATGGTEALQQATTGIRNLQYRDYLSRKLLLPPLGEQRKIAAILSSVDDAIEATKAVIDQLQVVKKAMMAELLTRGLPGRHTRFKMTEIGEVPEDWEVMTMDHLATARGMVGGPFGSDLTTKDYVEEPGVPVIRQRFNGPIQGDRIRLRFPRESRRPREERWTTGRPRDDSARGIAW